MIQENIKIDNGILLHYINEDKFKSNCVAIFLTVPLLRQTVTLNTLVPSILRRGTTRLNNMQALEIEMQKLYGASLNIEVDKMGDNFVIKFVMESIRDEIAGDNVFEKSIQNISELILSPYLEKGVFCNEYFEQEKKALDIVIKDKINDKQEYSKYRCVEEMFKKDGYGLYKYGYSEDIDNINNAQVYNQYLDILKTAKIDIYAYTSEKKDIVEKYLETYFNKDILKDRKSIYLPKCAIAFNKEKEESVNESLDVTQGKLFIGLNIDKFKTMKLESIMLFNIILGGGCNSKMFRNVREKEHLAYSANSKYYANTNIILMFAGIELKNYNKALTVMKKELQDTIKGNITKRELEDAKKAIISSLKTLTDEQYRYIEYNFSNELLNTGRTVEDIIANIEATKLSDIITVGKNIKINTIYYLMNANSTDEEVDNGNN